VRFYRGNILSPRPSRSSAIVAVARVLQSGSARASESNEQRCRLMRVGAVVRQTRVEAFDINNRSFSLPLSRQDLLFKIRHGRSHLLDFGEYSVLLV